MQAPFSYGPQEAAQYDGYFAKLDTASAGVLSGAQAAALLSMSGLPKPTLAAIWTMADVDRDNRLTRAEFRVAMHLAKRVKEGMPLPPVLPPELARTFAPAPAMGCCAPVGGMSGFGGSAPLSVGPCSSMPSSAALPGGLDSASGLGGLSVQAGSSSVGAPAPDPWVMSDAEAARYDAYFASLDTARTGFLSGAQAAPLLSKSGLPKETLSRIWGLSDADRDGRLSQREFRAAMHLAMRTARGTPLPATLPPALAQVGAPRSMGLSAADPAVQRSARLSVASASAESDFDAPDLLGGLGAGPAGVCTPTCAGAAAAAPSLAFAQPQSLAHSTLSSMPAPSAVRSSRRGRNGRARLARRLLLG